VGGKNPVPMADLRAALTSHGFTEVRTYIASGNVLLSAVDIDAGSVQEQFEQLLRTDFAVDTRVLILTRERWLAIAGAVPPTWQNDSTQKSDILFLFPEDDAPEIIQRLAPREGIDDARYVPGAVLWNVERNNQTRSALNRIVGTRTYKNLTIRNVNTVRKLTEFCDTLTP
jgi:uncharacterized protein (DUF1697 family)